MNFVYDTLCKIVSTDDYFVLVSKKNKPIDIQRFSSIKSSG